MGMSNASHDKVISASSWTGTVFRPLFSCSQACWHGACWDHRSSQYDCVGVNLCEDFFSCTRGYHGGFWNLLAPVRQSWGKFGLSLNIENSAGSQHLEAEFTWDYLIPDGSNASARNMSIIGFRWSEWPCSNQSRSDKGREIWDKKIPSYN